MSTAPTRCRDWLPQIHSFSLALALPARHSHREYLSARAARVSKQVNIALAARVACRVRYASPETRLDSSFNGIASVTQSLITVITFNLPIEGKLFIKAA